LYHPDVRFWKLQVSVNPFVNLVRRNTWTIGVENPDDCILPVCHVLSFLLFDTGSKRYYPKHSQRFQSLLIFYGSSAAVHNTTSLTHSLKLTAGQAKPSQTKPCQAKPSQAKPSQANFLTGGGDFNSQLKPIGKIMLKESIGTSDKNYE
jgi:hypothetical protein